MLVLTFQIGDDTLAIDIRRVREVVPRVRLAHVQGSPEWHAGVFVYRGEVVPVVDLHLLAGVGACPPHLSSRIILVAPQQASGNERLIGLLAAQVADTRDLPPTAGAAPSASDVGDVDLGVLIADGQGVLRLFDPDRFLPETAWRKLLSLSKGASS